ncbi:uncharacterized protein LOC130744793 [Lotus japonicus]|uniref:Uncharacterized protein n=1 Tax=Lotus japonicus TaxID=34305 RepID=I3S1D0_LOTJA|nr:uncharacterized protein LOC130744793 [Lotus japonicus]AFK34072.1 unknown [Lotus japonicus]
MSRPVLVASFFPGKGGKEASHVPGGYCTTSVFQILWDSGAVKEIDVARFQWSCFTPSKISVFPDLRQCNHILPPIMTLVSLKGERINSH